MHFKLNEGLKVGDLKDLVSPILSIDEFESKIDPDAIVVAFITLSSIETPAEDLSEFIETGKNEVLDTDVSPGPNSDGHYVLFVEFERSLNFPQSLMEVVDSLYSLTLNKFWKYVYFGGTEKRDLTMKNLQSDIRLEKQDRDVTPENIKESINFFKNSMLDDVKVTVDNLICLQKNNILQVKEGIAFGDPAMILTALNLQHVAIQLDAESLRECRNLRQMLGENWDVTKLNGHFVLSNSEDSRVMVIK